MELVLIQDRSYRILVNGRDVILKRDMIDEKILCIANTDRFSNKKTSKTYIVDSVFKRLHIFNLKVNREMKFPINEDIIDKVLVHDDRIFIVTNKNYSCIIQRGVIIKNVNIKFNEYDYLYIDFDEKNRIYVYDFDNEYLYDIENIDRRIKMSLSVSKNYYLYKNWLIYIDMFLTETSIMIFRLDDMKPIKRYKVSNNRINNIHMSTSEDKLVFFDMNYNLLGFVDLSNNDFDDPKGGNLLKEYELEKGIENKRNLMKTQYQFGLLKCISCKRIAHNPVIMNCFHVYCDDCYEANQYHDFNRDCILCGDDENYQNESFVIESYPPRIEFAISDIAKENNKDEKTKNFYREQFFSIKNDKLIDLFMKMNYDLTYMKQELTYLEDIKNNKISKKTYYIYDVINLECENYKKIINEIELKIKKCNSLFQYKYILFISKDRNDIMNIEKRENFLLKHCNYDLFHSFEHIEDVVIDLFFCWKKIKIKYQNM